MKYLKPMVLAVFFGTLWSCQENIEDQPILTETQSIIINNVVFDYQSEIDPVTGEKSIVRGENTAAIEAFFANNENYAMRVNLDNNEIRYYSTYSESIEFNGGDGAPNDSGCGTDNMEFVDVDGEECGNDEDGGGTGTGDPGGTGPTGSFDDCQGGVSIQFADASSGRGYRFYYPGSDPISDFRSITLYPFLSSPVVIDFNDVLTSVKLCRGGLNGIEVQLFEHINFGGKSIAFYTTQPELVVDNLNRYIKNSGFLGIGRENWDNEVSSAKFVPVF